MKKKHDYPIRSRRDTLSAEARWCEGMFASLAVDGGIWAVPRTGLVFQRRKGTLVLITAMPWELGMGCTQDELIAAQAEEYNVLRGYLEEAGITLWSELVTE